MAYPQETKNAEQVAQTLLHFNNKQPTDAVVCKSDAATEIAAAIRHLGWRPRASLENRWPHNAPGPGKNC